ncbi:hypothetical protein PTR23_07800 [Serratia nevei]|uniref:hypothetical protein n=1 Tax=Serratia TaxID=613 RepID=UPI00066B4150|nr:hypothetical protein [Serratia marcescens]
MRIENPTVLINQKEADGDYVIAITDGSANFHDMQLAVRVSEAPNGDDWTDTLESVCWYMAREIRRLRNEAKTEDRSTHPGNSQLVAGGH